MIVVDTSVWIATLKFQDTEPVRKLDGIKRPRDILVGDLIMLEVLQGAGNDKRANMLEAMLRSFEIVEMLDEQIALKAARNFRKLRSHGVTVRKTVDLIIATFCLIEGHQLLHDDRDFIPFEEYLGLRFF